MNPLEPITEKQREQAACRINRLRTGIRDDRTVAVVEMYSERLPVRLDGDKSFDKLANTTVLIVRVEFTLMEDPDGRRWWRCDNPIKPPPVTWEQCEAKYREYVEAFAFGHDRQRRLQSEYKDLLLKHEEALEAGDIT